MKAQLEKDGLSDLFDKIATEENAEDPEKLMAKIILASSNPGELVLDPFLGSGSTSVVANKLGRHYIGIDISEKYCEIARKRVEAAEKGITVKELEKGQKVLF